MRLFAPVRHASALSQATVCESDWMERCAASGDAQAHLWQAPRGWVVPRRYTLAPAWSSTGVASGLLVRASGGGLVPQGPGIWNLSLLWTDSDAGPQRSSTVYAEGCRLLGEAFRRLGVETHTGEAPGSLCDGRFNLLADGRKIAGTAQAWRRIQGYQIGLFHAVFFLRVDLEAITEEANRLEERLGHEIRYRASSMTTLEREAPQCADCEERFLGALGAMLSDTSILDQEK